MSAFLLRKAHRLLDEHRVQMAGVAALFTVRGDNATYYVVIGDDYRSCSCPAPGACSHLVAAGFALDELGERRARAYAQELKR